MELKSVEDLSEKDRTLVKLSEEAKKRAYNIYSKFEVGAAVRFADGTIVTGCNVENSSYGLTICAERTALVKAVSEGIKMDLDAIAVSAETDAQMVSPCGACRQFISEFGPNVPVYLHNPKTNEVAVTSMSYLLPNSFDFSLERNNNILK